MSELKCPFCQQEYILYKVSSCLGQQPCVCRNPNCEFDGWHFPVKFVSELIRTRKELEQSEICCAEWEKQALDYKAENIALSGELERTRKALDVAVDELTKIKITAISVGIGFFITAAISALEKIKTALEQKDAK